MEIIQVIRKEIISRINKRHLSKQAQNELVSILSFLSTLESEKPVPKDLEEAAEISFDEARALTEGYIYFLAKGLEENQPRPIGPHWFCEYAKNRFIAGAKWQKEQMKKSLLEWTKEQWLHTRNGTMADQIRSSAFEEMMKHIDSL